MKKVIASIKLAPGNRGYFDPLTGINLSISNNIGYIREGDNVDNIRRDIKNGKIKIVGGKLSPAINIVPEPEIQPEPVKEEKVVKEPKKDITPLFKPVETVNIKEEAKVKLLEKEIIKEQPILKKEEKKPYIPPAKREEVKQEKKEESVKIDVKDKQELEQASEKAGE